MATQAEKDKELERRTAIIGDMPKPGSYAEEQAKWDKQGNLIDPDEIAKNQRLRDIALTENFPLTREDFHDMEMADAVLGPEEPAPANSPANPPVANVPATGAGTPNPAGGTGANPPAAQPGASVPGGGTPNPGTGTGTTTTSTTTT